MSTKQRRRTADVIGRCGGRLLRNRALMRAPIGIYRARLGFLFGTRMLMMQHRGRRTGAVRDVVLEVIDHPAPGRYVVAAGFGRRAQWFRNVCADPHVRIWVGRHGPADAIARELTTGEADAALATYASRHRRAWNTFKPIVENTLGARVTERGTQLPMVELTLVVRP